MKRSMKTINLKLHNPSKCSREIIDEAMLNYSEAFQYLLDCAEKELDSLNLRQYSIAKWVDTKLSHRHFAIEPFKDSIKIDLQWTLSGYMNLKAKKAEASFPVSFIDNKDYEAEYRNIMSELIEGAENSSLLQEKLDRLIYKADKMRPIFFCRYSTSRNYCLLYNPQKNRYYAKIYLMNVKNKKRKKANPSSYEGLIYINEGMETFETGKRANCFLILPLAFGKWQEEYLKKALNNPSMLKTARLIKQRKDYFLSVNIEAEAHEPVETSCFMGICRGIDNLINYSVVNSEGELVSMGFEKAEAGILPDNKIHGIINSLVKTAGEYKCQVIVEKLMDKSDKLSWISTDEKTYLPQIDCHTYNRFTDILNYKLIDNGLPEAIKVSSTNIFYTCPYCGNTLKANRFSHDMLICTICGKNMDIESAGSFNLAEKLIKYKESSIKIYVQSTENGIRLWNNVMGFEYFSDNPFDCAQGFMKKIDEYIDNFYKNIQKEADSPDFKKKLSIIKKIQSDKNVFEMISIE